MVTNTTTSTMDWELPRKKKEHCSVEGINILELERELKDGSFGDVVSGYDSAEGSMDQRENVSRTP